MTAMQSTKENWCEAEVNRVAGEIALKSPEPDAEKAEGYFERALAVGRQQQAKSWELRAATSLARLWRDQGKVQQARELMAPVYGWFTEGFDTRDLMEATALLAATGSGYVIALYIFCCAIVSIVATAMLPRARDLDFARQHA